METDLAPAPTRPPWTRPGVLSLVLPLGTAVAILVSSLRASGAPDELTLDATLLAFLIWNLLPAAAMAVLLLRAARSGRRELMVALVGSGLVAVLTGLALWDFETSDSSTGALVFIFLPLYQWAVLVLTVVAVLFAHALGRRSADTR